MNEEMKMLGTCDHVLRTEGKDYFSAAKILKEEEPNRIRVSGCCEFPRRSPALCSLPWVNKPTCGRKIPQERLGIQGQREPEHYFLGEIQRGSRPHTEIA